MKLCSEINTTTKIVIILTSCDNVAPLEKNYYSVCCPTPRVGTVLDLQQYICCKSNINIYDLCIPDVLGFLALIRDEQSGNTTFMYFFIREVRSGFLNELLVQNSLRNITD